MWPIGATTNAAGTSSRKFVEDGDTLFSTRHLIFDFALSVHMAGQ
jgi:hypothetical protein